MHPCVFLCFFVVFFFFFFFSSRRRHTRCREVSWARRCVQETGTWGGRHGFDWIGRLCDCMPRMIVGLVNHRLKQQLQKSNSHWLLNLGHVFTLRDAKGQKRQQRSGSLILSFGCERDQRKNSLNAGLSIGFAAGRKTLMMEQACRCPHESFSGRGFDSPRLHQFSCLWLMF
eukprot:TRINITY_DN7902_c0_g1_i10.p1 TRINITY_DN7902_c0_g1~~TRINITY_DN7902_c0_g1_i10.p1  ORF type:complete len:172 (+),score=27.72 TRINITY_DN7902_c0_g1_i10:87-602(+)